MHVLVNKSGFYREESLLDISAAALILLMISRALLFPATPSLPRSV
jgi:hypothetical protein